MTHSHSQPASFVAGVPQPLMGVFFTFVPYPTLAPTVIQTPVRTFPSGHRCSHPPRCWLPPALVALLRGKAGPFLANEVFSITSTQALAAIDEPVPAPEWYTITRGRFVGVVGQFALSAVAISGVAHSARKAYMLQSLALNAFNQALTWGGVQVV
ncbi:hypothetical protein B0H17DRAFT_1191151 [Mycena rosella]|uniref:Uncharacterized protein n=1 Tax=Mycena rosella TaxID=1033263 RepID=A0AAD7H1G8_MYCRO|nr:hypothetical protein B0H17DRAFT_1191151 [Mycena rosella]